MKIEIEGMKGRKPIMDMTEGDLFACSEASFSIKDIYLITSEHNHDQEYRCLNLRTNNLEWFSVFQQILPLKCTEFKVERNY